ncbi:MAG: DUF6335 family protein [Acidobacteriota bacterium]|nr:DUF6335 family protein [Acidobacteriota bacterium]
MAREKPARPAAKRAKKKAAPKGARRTAAKQVRKAAKRAGSTARKAAKSARNSARKAAKPIKKAVAKARTMVRAAAKSAAKTKTGKAARAAVGRAAKAAASTRPGKIVKRTVVTARAVKAGVVAALTPPKGAKKPNIDRPRKTVADIHGIPSSLGMGRMASAAHSGGEELRHTLRDNTSASPALTAGDVDADWQSAETVGDEAPGGDNPTPDQDVVDEIGRALGVEYEDDEELQGGAEIAERDAHRWELDPSSKDDFDEEK